MEAQLQLAYVVAAALFIYGLANWLAVAAVAPASIDVVGGYPVTDRMLAMFKKKKQKREN